MPEKPRSKAFTQAVEEYINRGEQCALWGVPSVMMNREELLAFIGFLDEQLELHMKGLGSCGKH